MHFMVVQALQFTARQKANQAIGMKTGTVQAALLNGIIKANQRKSTLRYSQGCFFILN